jgi:hypothetical protein
MIFIIVCPIIPPLPRYSHAPDAILGQNEKPFFQAFRKELSFIETVEDFHEYP